MVFYRGVSWLALISCLCLHWCPLRVARLWDMRVREAQGQGGTAGVNVALDPGLRIVEPCIGYGCGSLSWADSARRFVFLTRQPLRRL